MIKKLSANKRKYFFVLIIVLIAEVYLFNFRYWCTLIPDEQSIPISDISTDENASVDGNRFKLLSTENVRFLFQYSGEWTQNKGGTCGKSPDFVGGGERTGRRRCAFVSRAQSLRFGL